MRKQFVKWMSCVVSLYLAAAVLPAVHIDSPAVGLAAGTVLWLLNLLLRPLLLLLTLPINLITLGAFSLIVNTWMVVLTDRFFIGLHIPGFWQSLATALIVTVFGLFARTLIREK